MMKHITIEGKDYLIFEDDEGNFFAIEAVKIESCTAYLKEFDKAVWEALDDDFRP